MKKGKRKKRRGKERKKEKGWKEEEEHFERIYACASGHGGM